MEFFWDKPIVTTALFIEVDSVSGTLLSVSHTLTQFFHEALEFPVVFGGLVSPEARSLPHIPICH